MHWSSADPQSPLRPKSPRSGTFTQPNFGGSITEGETAGSTTSYAIDHEWGNNSWIYSGTSGGSTKDHGTWNSHGTGS